MWFARYLLLPYRGEGVVAGAGGGGVGWKGEWKTVPPLAPAPRRGFGHFKPTMSSVDMSRVLYNCEALLNIFNGAPLMRAACFTISRV